MGDFFSKKYRWAEVFGFGVLVTGLSLLLVAPEYKDVTYDSVMRRVIALVGVLHGLMVCGSFFWICEMLVPALRARENFSKYAVEANTYHVLLKRVDPEALRSAAQALATEAHKAFAEEECVLRRLSAVGELSEADIAQRTAVSQAAALAKNNFWLVAKKLPAFGIDKPEKYTDFLPESR